MATGRATSVTMTWMGTVRAEIQTHSRLIPAGIRPSSVPGVTNWAVPVSWSSALSQGGAHNLSFIVTFIAHSYTQPHPDCPVLHFKAEIWEYPSCQQLLARGWGCQGRPLGWTQTWLVLETELITI